MTFEQLPRKITPDLLRMGCYEPPVVANDIDVVLSECQVPSPVPVKLGRAGVVGVSVELDHEIVLRPVDVDELAVDVHIDLWERELPSDARVEEELFELAIRTGVLGLVGLEGCFERFASGASLATR